MRPATTTTLTKRLLEKFFPTIFVTEKVSDEETVDEDHKAEASSTYLEVAVPEIEVLQGVRNEAQRLRKMRNDELDRAESMAKKFKELESERITILTKSKVEDDADLKKEADKHLKEMEKTERQRKDSVMIAERLAVKSDKLVPKIQELERASLLYLGKYLEGRMEALVDHYNETAPEVAETVLQIRAVQKVMQHYGTGNSNGFQGEVHLPSIVAFDHKITRALLSAGSKEFTSASNEISEKIKSKLQAAGHVYGVKYR